MLLISNQDAHDLLHKFTSENIPTLYNVFPAVEELMTAWETKSSTPRYVIFSNALQAGINKLNKYYNWFDLNPCIIVNLGMLCRD